MGLTVFYLPRHKLNAPALWDTIRAWQKTNPGGWDKLRFTPDFYDAQGFNRSEMSAVLDMVRLKQVDRVVYAELDASQTANLDWLAFVYSLRGNSIPVESLDGKLLDLELQLEKLAQGFNQLQNKGKGQPAKLKQDL